MAEKEKSKGMVKAADSREQMQRRYMELQLLSHQIKDMQKQVQTIDGQLMDLEATNNALDELSKTKEKSEMFVPVSSGVFAMAELKGSKELLVNVGAGVAVKKPISDVREMIDEQLVELGNYRQQALAQLESQIVNAKKLEKELRNIAE